MRITQGTFSFLPDLSEEQIRRQVDYALGRRWAVSVESTDDPHPRNVYWDMWDMPAFDLDDPDVVMQTVNACRRAHPDRYVKLNAFDPTSGWETVRLSFIVQRPKDEPGFCLMRLEGPGRSQRYGLRGYAAERPAGQRYPGSAW
ncbi:MAG TPA: ribulose bisphosphate carboxylase small subunit [Anaeromyxobacteraceae bacterium]|nr:ribulose bisphosphate carboxylase small subunit [Anaeromyxobacteraceae bacterium]